MKNCIGNEILMRILELKIAKKKWSVINIKEDSINVLTKVPLLVFEVCNCPSSGPTTFKE